MAQIKRDKSSSKAPVQFPIGALTVTPEVFPVLASSVLMDGLMVLPPLPVPTTFLTASVLTLSALFLPPSHLLNHVFLLLALEVFLALVFSLTLIPRM